MRIGNVRLGFACNSSSSHSILLLRPGARLSSEGPSDDSHYGWGYFVLADEPSKMDYFAAQVFSALSNEIDPQLAAIAAAELSGVPRDPAGHAPDVDHQSRWVLPSRLDGTLNLEFLGALKEYLRRPDVVVLGGNDNDNSRSYSRDLGQELPLPLEDFSRSYVARRDGQWWVIFNRRTGAKIRLSFEDNPAPLRKASAPELVDLKITDYCSYGCSYCYQGSTVKGLHATLNNCHSIARALSAMGVFEVAIGGGEPTHHPNFSGIVKLLSDKGIRPAFTTRNLEWLEDPNNEDTLSLCSAVAVSVESAGGVLEVQRIRSALTARRPSWQPPKIQVQYVIGSAPTEGFHALLAAAKNSWVGVTLLGPKYTGRGGKLEAQQTAEQVRTWLAAVKELGPGSIGIDTTLASLSQEQLHDHDVPHIFYSMTEGAFSMYIDAVEGKMAKSSYELDGAVPLPRSGAGFAPNLLGTVRTFFQSLPGEPGPADPATPA